MTRETLHDSVAFWMQCVASGLDCYPNENGRGVALAVAPTAAVPADSFLNVKLPVVVDHVLMYRTTAGLAVVDFYDHAAADSDVREKISFNLAANELKSYSLEDGGGLFLPLGFKVRTTGLTFPNAAIIVFHRV